jgi:ubiquinone/menaquinone biosynthesis C-methylase UbiE
MSGYIIKSGHKMEQGAAIYHTQAPAYELFSKAEDAPSFVAEYLTKELVGKNVLDVGCGTGKYLGTIASVANRYIGLDCSMEQLKIAKEKSRQHSNVLLIRSFAQQTGLGSACMDAVICAWVLDSIRNTQMQNQVLEETNRVLRKQGAFYVVENTGDCEFEDIIRRKPDISTTKQTGDWLLYNGFDLVKTLESYFLFSSFNQAKEVFSTIWNENIAQRVKDRKINHNINIYKKVKS